MSIDQNIFLWINGLAGRVAFFDGLAKGLANDYFVIVGSALLVLALWFGTREAPQRRKNQVGAVSAALSLAAAQGLVSLSNLFYFRERPFVSLPTNLLFYQPSDSSFPSNVVAVMFALGTAIFLVNRKAGAIILALAFAQGFSRIFVGVHFPSDVLAGMAIGVGAAFGVSRLVRSQEPIIGRLLTYLERYNLT